MMHALLSRFAATAVLLPPEMQSRFDACLHALSANPKLADMLNERAAADDGFWPSPDDWRAQYRPYIVRDGILQIPVKGVLLHGFSFAVGSWATGYEYIWRAYERGMNDPTVRGIALICDTPGGEAAGCFDLAEKMYALRDQKPVRGFAHESAYSAGYMVISVAPKIIMSRTGGVGSIGVYVLHFDYSKYMERLGVTPTYIDEPQGGFKTDGNPYQPLSEEVQARIRVRIKELYDLFVRAVVRNRGMSDEDVRGTKAATFTASQATSNGLADGIGSLDDAVAAFAADLSYDEGDDEMANEKKDEAAAEQTAALTAAKAEGKAEGHAEGKKEGMAEGQKVERERVTKILTCDAAKTRPAAAQNIALKTDMTPEQAAELLATLPEDGKGDKASALFEAAMDKNNPNLGTEPAAEGEKSGSASILADFRAFTGEKSKKTA